MSQNDPKLQPLRTKFFLFILPILKTHLAKVCWVAQHVHIKKLCHISATVRVIFLSERWADSSTLFLDHLTLLRLGPCCPDSPDQLPQSDRSWHSLEDIKKKKINKQSVMMAPIVTKTEKLHFSWKKPHKVPLQVHLLRSVLHLNKWAFVIITLGWAANKCNYRPTALNVCFTTCIRWSNGEKL